jgi:diamine N-acetyltransferase
MLSALRVVTLDDIEQAVSFVGQYYQFDSIAFDAERVRRGILQLIGNPALGFIWFIAPQGQPVGHVVLTFSFDLEFGGRVATVTEVFIEKSARAQGLGRRVFQELEAICRANEIGALELQVKRDNSQAQQFYKKLGFHFHDRLPGSKLLQ